MPIISNYLEKESIKVEKFDKTFDSFVYSDEYQVVVVNEK